MINKVENLKPIDKSYIIFDYFRIIELLSGIYMELNFKVYNYLTNLCYECLFLVDLKYAYLIIFLYLKDRYYFIFIISGIG